MAHTGVIADDLTGANDTAIQFAKHGMRTFVHWNLQRGLTIPDCADVAVLDTETRPVSAREAYQIAGAAARLLQSAGISRIYKKMDSTLRGNVGAEIRAIADIFRPEITVIAPAYPRYGRTTEAGHQCVHGRPVSLTETACDPRSPVSQSFLPDLIRAQTEAAVELVTSDVVSAGRTAVAEAIAGCLARGRNWIVFDVVVDRDLRNIAAAAAEYPAVLWVGSTGLAEMLPEALALPTRPKMERQAGADGPALVIAGSVSASVRAQIDELVSALGSPVIQVDPEQALRNPAAEIAACLAQARAAGAGNPAAMVISSAAAIGSRDRGLAEGLRLGISGTDVGARIARMLGSIAGALAGDGCSGMVLTGGDTAFAVCRTLKVDYLEVIEEVAPGIPMCVSAGHRSGSLRIVTKAGGFGDRNALVKAVRALRGKESHK
jgi:D-threonate/D-erythronate kinase